MDSREALVANKIEFKTSGSGPHAILTHGWKNDHSIWEPLIEELQGDFTCLVWDLPAHGGSPSIEPGADPHSEVLNQLDYLVDYCSHASGHPPILIGHSLGGYFSLSYAIRNPLRVAGLGLLATGPGYKREEPREIWNRWVLDNADPSRPGQAELCLQRDSHVVDGLTSIGRDVVVVAGERDVGFAASADLLSAKIAGSHKTEISGAGHMLHKTHAAECAAALRNLVPDDGD